MTQENLAIRVTLLPKDTNRHGTIFGGVILSQMDLAAAIEASNHSTKKLVTVAFDAVVFLKPVYVGDLVSIYTTTEKVGTKSVTVGIRVEAIRGDTREVVQVTTGKATFVAVDNNGKSTSLESADLNSILPPVGFTSLIKGTPTPEGFYEPGRFGSTPIVP